MLNNWTGGDSDLIKLHLRDIQTLADEIRLARKVRESGRVRRRLGRMLIASGRALIGKTDALDPRGIALPDCAHGSATSGIVIKRS